MTSVSEFMGRPVPFESEEEHNTFIRVVQNYNSYLAAEAQQEGVSRLNIESELSMVRSSVLILCGFYPQYSSAVLRGVQEARGTFRTVGTAD